MFKGNNITGSVNCPEEMKESLIENGIKESAIVIEEHKSSKVGIILAIVFSIIGVVGITVIVVLACTKRNKKPDDAQEV